MAFGLGVLRLGPTEFWAMSPREIEAAARGLSGPSAQSAPRRAALEALMQRFPDRRKDAER
jgi:uncharacterized phage protein (TIGR02216 family)